MKIILIKMMMLSLILGTRVFDANNPPILGNNRSCGERPILDKSIVSSSGHFIIHYNNYYDGIDEYAYNVAIAADSSRSTIVDIMNFRTEVSDEDGLYDIYIEQLPNGTYGWNCPEGDIGKSWVEIDDDYIGSNYSTTGLDAMKISVAHEYFHAIQRAYVPMPGQNSFFYELSSIWIEDIIFPDVDDYIFFSQFGDAYFSNPEKNMNDYNGYGLGLYGHYMNFKFDNQIMQRIWENFALMDSNNEDEYVFNAIDNILSNENYGYNSSFVQTWLDFNAKNLFNGYFNNMQNGIYYYEDQIQFNPIESNPNIIDSLEIVNFDVNNKSVSIESFYPYDFPNDNTLYSFFNISNNLNLIDLSDCIGLIAVPNNTLISNIGNIFQSSILNHSDVFHILYISNLESFDFETLITSTIVYNPHHIITFPNPVPIEGQVTFRMLSEINDDNFHLKLYDINGKFFKKIKLDNFNYSSDGEYQSSIKLFDENFPVGVYILSFNLNGKIINKKITYLK